ncbi:hypothetical protein [Celeribacter baekdonensis]|nr:hypothetical protein [Celeribacter baekdonensis]
MMQLSKAPFTRLAPETITSSMTWTKPQRLRDTDLLQVELWGGGGGGGDESHGQGGSYSVEIFTAAEIPATVEIEVGSGGNGDGYGTGGPGGNTSFGALFYAPGGLPGRDRVGPDPAYSLSATEVGSMPGKPAFKAGGGGNGGTSQFAGGAGAFPAGGGLFEGAGAAGQVKIKYL